MRPVVLPATAGIVGNTVNPQTNSF